MSTTYRMKISYNQVQLTVIDFGRKPYEREYYPTESTRDRFTDIANSAIRQDRPELPARLLLSDDGFGWEMTRYAVRGCANDDCGKPIYEFDRARFESTRYCWDCEFREKRRNEAMAAVAAYDTIAAQ